MGNLVYYALPHQNTWYCYQRDAENEYEDAPVGIWHNATEDYAVRMFMNQLNTFKDSDARAIYLYRGMKRKARAHKEDGIIIKSPLLEKIIKYVNTYERLDIEKIRVRLWHGSRELIYVVIPV